MIIKLAPDEEIIAIFRKHWFVYFMDTLILLILFVLPYIAFRLMGLSESIPLVGPTYHLMLFLYVTWFVLLWTYFFVAWTRHYLDALVVTNKRMVDIEQISLFHRELIVSHYEKIQDITVETKGVMATLLNFGDITIQTASEENQLVLHFIPNPGEARRIITENFNKTMALGRQQIPDL